MDILKLEFMNFASLIRVVFGYLFPEYPPIGIVVVGLSLLAFVVYIFKSGFFPAVKVAVVVLFVLSCCLVVLHHMAKILHINLMF